MLFNLRGLFFLSVFALILAVIMSPDLTGAEPAEVVDRIVAIVNDDIITLSQLNQLMAPVEKKVRESGYISEKDRKKLFQLREQALNQLIEQKLLKQEIEKASLTISEQEIDETIENVKKANYITDEELRKSLAQEGLTMEGYRKKLKDQILRTRLMNLKIKSKIIITKEEINNYFEEHKDDFSGETKYHLRNIIMNKPKYSSTEEIYAIRAKMEALHEKLKNGASFADLARIYSESHLASKGGDLGFIKPSLFSPQIQAALKGLKTGQFTNILDTDQGYQILYIEEISELSGKSLEEASSEIEKTLYNETLEKMLQSWISDLKKEAHIKVIN